MRPHGNLLNPRERRIFDFQKNVSRKKNKEGYRVASGDKLIEATNKVETILKFVLEDYSKTINWMIHKSE